MNALSLCKIAADIRRGRGHIIADKRCEEKKIHIIENLDNLDTLQEYETKFFYCHNLVDRNSWTDRPTK